MDISSGSGIMLQCLLFKSYRIIHRRSLDKKKQ